MNGSAWRIGLAACLGVLLLTAGGRAVSKPVGPKATTPIKHLVVIFQENHSFDAYFATYPVAANPPNQPHFRARPGTPSVNGLTPTLIERNPNSSRPFRIDRTQSYTCDQDHEYTAEQRARNGGLMDRFPRFDAEGPTNARQFCHKGDNGHWDTVMGYFDGNTVTALWNYAQHFALSDNSFATMSGQSTRGALNLTAGDTSGVLCGPRASVYGDVPECGGPASSTATAAPTNGRLGTFVDDTDPFWDVCSEGKPAALTGRNVGDLLTAANVTWGWFQGGFTRTPDGKCSTSHPLESFDRAVGVDPRTDPLKFQDYVPHHNPFQYFASTANPLHLPPTSVAMVGKTDQANHLYDITWFWQAARAGNLPAVSFLKAPAYQNGHPGNSNPLDEQTFLVETLNRLQQLPRVAQHGGDHRRRRLGRLVRPRDAADHQSVEHAARLPLRQPHRRAGRPLRLRAAPAAARDLALCQAELREPRADRPDVDPALHRGQLAPGPAHQRDLLRQLRGLPRRHVRLLAAGHAPALAGSRHRPARARRAAAALSIVWDSRSAMPGA